MGTSGWQTGTTSSFNTIASKGRGGYDAKNGKGNTTSAPNRDRGHPDLSYRLEDAPKSKIKSLAGASDNQLVSALDSDNLFGGIRRNVS